MHGGMWTSGGLTFAGIKRADFQVRLESIKETRAIFLPIKAPEKAPILRTEGPRLGTAMWNRKSFQRRKQEKTNSDLEQAVTLTRQQGGYIQSSSSNAVLLG